MRIDLKDENNNITKSVNLDSIDFDDFDSIDVILVNNTSKEMMLFYDAYLKDKVFEMVITAEEISKKEE